MKSKRKINFCAGPAAIELDVLEEIQRDLVCYKDSGISVLEMFHRSKDFEKIIKQAENDITELLKIPNTYKILFLQGGATAQFSAIPLNLLGNKTTADYIITGLWSEKAAKEASKYCNVNICASNKSTNYTEIPQNLQLSSDPAYVYYCDNETAHGVQFKSIPEIPSHIPLVGDFSSSLLTADIDVSRFGIIFAGAQKNLGTAGVTIVIIRNDLLNRSPDICPSVLNYKIMTEHESMYNTPPCFNIYVTATVLKNAKLKGIQMLEQETLEKSRIIYEIIDKYPEFYISNIDRNSRSNINIVFKIRGGSEPAQKFIEMAAHRNIIQISGYRTIGGIRISLYNAVSIQNVQILANLMMEFMNLVN
jgi:phosphoserine aminotransferase